MKTTTLNENALAIVSLMEQMGGMPYADAATLRQWAEDVAKERGYEDPAKVAANVPAVRNARLSLSLGLIGGTNR